MSNGDEIVEAALSSSTNSWIVQKWSNFFARKHVVAENIEISVPRRNGRNITIKIGRMEMNEPHHGKCVQKRQEHPAAQSQFGDLPALECSNQTHPTAQQGLHGYKEPQPATIEEIDEGQQVSYGIVQDCTGRSSDQGNRGAQRSEVSFSQGQNQNQSIQTGQQDQQYSEVLQNGNESKQSQEQSNTVMDCSGNSAGTPMDQEDDSVRPSKKLHLDKETQSYRPPVQSDQSMEDNPGDDINGERCLTRYEPDTLNQKTEADIEMGSGNSTTFNKIDIEVPTVTYVEDDNGLRGEVGKRKLTIGSVTVSGDCRNLPTQLMLAIEKREEEREALTEGRKQKEREALTEGRKQKDQYKCPKVRLESLKICACATKASERITLVKAGYFYAVREKKLQCFWCSHQLDVAKGGKPFNSKYDLFHANCDYSRHMKDEDGKLSCIDQSEDIDRLCKRMECPLCRWDR